MRQAILYSVNTGFTFRDFFQIFFIFFALPPRKILSKNPYHASPPPALLLAISRPFSRSVPVAFFSLKKTSYYSAEIPAE